MKQTFSVELTEGQDDINSLLVYAKAMDYSIAIEKFFIETRAILKYDDSDKARKLHAGLESAREIMLNICKERGLDVL